MIDIKELNKLSKILNLHELCEVSGLRYGTIHKRLLEHRTNPNRGKISREESSKFIEGLHKYKLNFQRNLYFLQENQNNL